MGGILAIKSRSIIIAGFFMAASSLVPVLSYTQAANAEAVGKLPLHRALVEAYNRNPDLEAARAELRSIDENYVQAKAGFKPSISGSASYTSSHSERGVSKFNSDPKVLSLDINQPLYSGGSTIANVNKTYNNIKAGRANLKVVEQNILYQG